VEHVQRLAIIAVLNLIVYYKTLFYGYVGDDVERSERKQEFKNAWHRRWLQFMGLKHINSMVSHFLTIITHTVCCCAIYLALGRNNISFLTAILFSINPINMQGSVWISGRNYVVSSILALGMFAFPTLSWVFYTATGHFAVNAWFAPLVFLGTKHWYMVFIIPVVWLLSQHNKDTLKRKLWETGGLKTTNTEMRSMKPKKIIPFLKTHLYYFILCIIPFQLGIEHNFLRGFGTNATDNKKGYKLDKYFYAGLTLFLGVSISCIIGILRGHSPLTWGLLWFTVNIAMWCNYITIQQQISERYVYLANIGLMYALASVIVAYPIAITIFITAYLVRLWYVMDMYMNDYWTVEYTLHEMKDMHYMWLMRGVKKWMAKDHQGALYDFNEAYIHKPYDLKILYNLSVACFVLGDTVRAREYLDKAKQNVYDELEVSIKPAFDNLETNIKNVEDSRARGDKMINIDLKDVMIVK